MFYFQLFTHRYTRRAQINFIYPFDELQSKSLQKQTYYKTDSHWNMLGAETAFFILINKISEKGTVFNKEPFKKNDSYFLQEFANHNFGDLKDLANLNTNFPLDDKAYTVKLLVDPINKIYKEENPLIKMDGKMKFKNENASNKLKVLVIHDSFSVALSVFFNLHFSDTYFVSYYCKNDDDWIKEITNIINDYKPQLVVYETVERNF